MSIAKSRADWKVRKVIDLVHKASQRLDKKFLAYSLVKSKIELQLVKMIGFEMEKILQQSHPDEDYRIEYNFSNNNLKRVDLVIFKGYLVETIVEIKQYYSFDPVKDNWSSGYFKPLNKDIRKLEKNYGIEQKFLLIFLGHYHSDYVSRRFAYSRAHNRNAKSSGEELLQRAENHLDSYLVLNESPYKIWNIDLDTFEQIPVKLIIGISQVK